MPKIKVNTNKIGTYESDMQGVLSRVNSIMNKFNSVSRNLDWDIKAESNINSRLSVISRELSAESRGMSDMKRYLCQARSKYNEVESKNSRNLLKNEITGSGIGTKVFDGRNAISNIGQAAVGKTGLSFSEVNFDKTYLTWCTGKDGLSDKGTVFSRPWSFEKDFVDHKFEVNTEISPPDIDVSTKFSPKVIWDIEKGDISADLINVSAGSCLAKGSIAATYGQAGIVASANVGEVAVSGKIGATLFKDGKFAPEIGAGVKAEVNAAKVDVKTNIGSEENNLHGKVSGQFLGYVAAAKLNVGKIEYVDSEGNKHTKYGVETDIGAESYVAKGSISGGITIFGINIDVSVEGKAGGGGAKAGGGVTNSSASGEIGLGFILGLGAKVNVDWSNFTLFK